MPHFHGATSLSARLHPAPRSDLRPRGDPAARRAPLVAPRSAASPGSLAFALALLVLAFGCGNDPRAELDVGLAGPATVVPEIFHGNCLVGYSLSVELEVRETRGVDVVLDVLDFRLREEGSGSDLSGERLDAQSLEDRYGPGARSLAGHGVRTFRVGARYDRGAGAEPIAVSGSLSGRDLHDHRVEAAFDLRSAVEFVGEPPGSSGACSPP